VKVNCFVGDNIDFVRTGNSYEGNFYNLVGDNVGIVRTGISYG
jgi:hypothetical protein